MEERGGAWEGRAVKFADSYEILEPQEAPRLPRLRARAAKAFADGFDCLFYFVQHIAHRHAQTEGRVPAPQVLLEIQKENPDIPTIQELYELDSVSDAYLRSQYTILGSEAWRAA